MATEIPQHGGSASKMSRTMGSPFSVAVAGAQEECRYPLIHCEAAISAIKNMTMDGYLKSFLK